VRMTISLLSRGLLICLAPAWLAACGWHLRGSIDLPQDLGVYVQSSDRRLQDTWRQELAATGVPLAAKPEEADYVLIIDQETFQSRVLSVNAATGKTQEFELAYATNYRVRRPDGSLVVGPDTARVVRSLLLDQTAVLGTEREAQLSRQEMRAAAAAQILRRVQVATRNPANATQP